MKKIINILLAVCLMVSMLGVSALAEGEYTGPATHTLPVYIDFNDETVGDNYPPYSTDPENFYNLKSHIRVKSYDETDTTDKYIHVDSTPNVGGAMGIKIADFTYDEAAAEAGNVQPTKLVVSMEVKYGDTVPKSGISSLTIGGGSHIKIGKITDSDMALNSGYARFDRAVLAWDYNIDTAGLVTGAYYNTDKTFSETALDNHAYIEQINDRETMYYTFVIDLTRDAYNRTNVYTYINGSSTGKMNSITNIETIDAMVLSGWNQIDFNVDNIRIYTIDNAKIAATGSSVDELDVVPVTTNEVIVNFSHEIIDAADKYIVVKKGEQVLEVGEDYTIEHVYSTEEGTAKTAKSLKVKFNEALSYETEYTIGGSADYYGIDGYALEAETEFATFTTEAAPQINLSNLEVSKGFFGGTAVASLNDVIGSTANVKVTVTNAEDASAVGTVFFGVYKNDVLVSLAFVNKTFATAETEDITANLKIPAVSSGDTLEIKAFVCEGLGNLDAYATPLSLSTAD